MNATPRQDKKLAAQSNPLPNPDILKKYEQMLPGVTDRIIKMVEAQSAHRIKTEETIVSETYKLEKTGMNYAFAITIILAIIGAFLIYTGSSAEGLAAILVPLSLHIFNYLVQRGKQESPVNTSDRKPAR